ncbi:MAG: hypothetical protein U1A27_01960 [Phycisphaerae bacterium]
MATTTRWNKILQIIRVIRATVVPWDVIPRRAGVPPAGQSYTARMRRRFPRTLLAIGALAAINGMPPGQEETDFPALAHALIRQARLHVKISARQALAAAVRESPDDPPFALLLTIRGSRPAYIVDLLTATGIRSVTVDAAGESIWEHTDLAIDPAESAAHQRDRAALLKSRDALAHAIEAAERRLPGAPVVSVRADDGADGVVFEVELLADNAFKRVRVDATGQSGPPQDAPDIGQAWTFDDAPADRPPPGWQFGYTHAAGGHGEWKIVRDDRPKFATNILRLAARSDSTTFNLALATGTSYQDVDVRVRLRPDSGREDRGGGLVWRCRDADNYYLCRLNPLESNFRVYRVVAGKRTQLASADAIAAAGKWYALRATMVGNHIVCRLDEQKLLDVTDNTIKSAGMIGLWTKADASSSFDNLAVQPAK